MDAARSWALRIASFQKPWVLTLYRTDKLESLGEAREILKLARAQAKKTAPNLKHPSLCLDAIEEGVIAGGYAGLLKVKIVCCCNFLVLLSDALRSSGSWAILCAGRKGFP